MSASHREHSALPITLSSSIEDDVWHEQKGPMGFECWQFDALSDDGRQALVISFYDNYPASPRYLRAGGLPLERSGAAKFPAVSIVYSVDGKSVLSAVNESSADQFSSGTVGVNCTIGQSWFRVDSADYGTGYVLNVELITARNRHIKAELEWLSIESDLNHGASTQPASAAVWNIVSPRSDVSGRITLSEKSGDVVSMFHFRGSGSHDHLRSSGPLHEDIASRWWGRAHFVEHTAVFQALELADGLSNVKLMLIKGNSAQEFDAEMASDGFGHSRFGIKVPRALRFTANGDVSLEVRPTGVIESGLCDIKLFASMVLRLGDDDPHESTGMMAVQMPGRLRRKLIRRLSGLRIGTNGKAPLF